jgi:hypothetical protein
LIPVSLDIAERDFGKSKIGGANSVQGVYTFQVFRRFKRQIKWPVATDTNMASNMKARFVKGVITRRQGKDCPTFHIC